ncbi:hypothetical protein HZI73_06290 [Vallitalea pronyensis]|uniref:Nitrogen regulatory protein P-II n=1 Tax=Vallitalea pronyensis TaxID=1348613 RepID=A0A8J8MHY3_9FIRM|nr:P-II family nitrogen regulator [Vallitalea pronyensis]QUI21934.1 hypothetical protein HZI73_06290 [Vallitalea pronyensis]
MIACKYILFIVMNDVKKVKHVKKKLAQLDISRYTMIDTFGVSALESCGVHRSMVLGSLGNVDNKKYNKTIFVALPSEEMVLKVMDEMEEVLNIGKGQTGKGIMFTVPIYRSHGVRK